MKEVENTEDKLVFSDGDKTIQFNRLQNGVAMEVVNIMPSDAELTVENFLSYIAWEHHVDPNDIEHGEGRCPSAHRNGWDRLKDI